ncbi:MAG: hypothetical protein ACK549_04275 [Cyanobacteriota bacterium]
MVAPGISGRPLSTRRAGSPPVWASITERTGVSGGEAFMLTTSAPSSWPTSTAVGQKANPVARICCALPASAARHRTPPLDPVPNTPDQPVADAPESSQPSRHWRLTLDRFGFLEAIGGLVLGLIALFSSYDHITVFSRTIGLQQQWGILFIAASVATIFVDAQLASRSRLREAQDAARREDETAQERDRANQERDRADQERDRAAEARERQAQVAERQNEGLALLHRSALLSGRVQLDPTPSNRARFQLLLTLMAASSLDNPDG